MAKSPKKSKTAAANLRVPQSPEEAAAFVGFIGLKAREVARIETAMNDEIAAAKEAAAKLSTPLNAEIAALTEGLRVYCDANRERLTDGGKVKFHEFWSGKVEWRHLPPSVRMKPGVKADDVVDWLETEGGLFTDFVRTKVELDKEAMLANVDLAKEVPGVTIGSAGEQFTVAPFETTIEGGK